MASMENLEASVEEQLTLMGLGELPAGLQAEDMEVLAEVGEAPLQVGEEEVLAVEVVARVTLVWLMEREAGEADRLMVASTRIIKPASEKATDS